jgi:hypothetical protein
MSFADTLQTLPEFTGKKLVLTDATGAEVAVIANAPGTAGSFRVYAYLAEKYRGIARRDVEGLAISPSTDDARLNLASTPASGRWCDHLGARPSPPPSNPESIGLSR